MVGTMIVAGCGGGSHPLSAQAAVTAHLGYAKRINSVVSGYTSDLQSGRIGLEGPSPSTCSAISSITNQEAHDLLPKLANGKIGTLIKTDHDATAALGKACGGDGFRFNDAVTAYNNTLTKLDDECAVESLKC